MCACQTLCVRQAWEFAKNAWGVHMLEKGWSPRPRRVSGGGGGANLTMLGHKYAHAGCVCVCCVCRCVCVIKKETRHSHRLEQSVFIIFEHLHFKRKNWLHKYKTSCLENFFLSDIQKKRRKN